LARLDHLQPAVAWAIAFCGSGNERFEQRSLSPVHGVHFGDFDQPLAAQVLRHILAARDVGQAVRKIVARKHGACGRFQLALRPFEHQHVVGFASRLKDARHSRRLIASPGTGSCQPKTSMPEARAAAV
jgi:hypothetical protein